MDVCGYMCVYVRVYASVFVQVKVKGQSWILFFRCHCPF